MIEVLTAELTAAGYWSCWLRLAGEGEEWLLPATAPGDVQEGALLGHFEGRAGELWRVAREKQYRDLYEVLDGRVLVRALSAAVRAEVNELRARAGLGEKSAEEWEERVRESLKVLGGT